MINKKYKTIKRLGIGAFGTVYLVKDKKGKKYAMKIEKINSKNIPKSTKSKHWREINFAKTMSSKYPKHFMKLYNYNIKKDCDYVHNWDSLPFRIEDIKNTYLKKQLIKLEKSSDCSIKVYSFVDYNFKDIINKLKNSKNGKIKIYDIIIQILYIIYLMKKNKYYHADFYNLNIGFVKTKDKTIKILGKDIPTHGYFIVPIDYGNILSSKYNLNKTEQKLFKYKNELLNIIGHIFAYMYSIDELKNLGLKYSTKPTVSKKDKELLEKLLNDKKTQKLNKEIKNDLINYLYKIIFYQKFQKEILGKKLKEPIPPIEFIPISNFIYMVCNIYQPKKILEYFLFYRNILK